MYEAKSSKHKTKLLHQNFGLLWSGYRFWLDLLEVENLEHEPSYIRFPIHKVGETMNGLLNGGGGRVP